MNILSQRPIFDALGAVARAQLRMTCTLFRDCRLPMMNPDKAQRIIRRAWQRHRLKMAFLPMVSKGETWQKHHCQYALNMEEFRRQVALHPPTRARFKIDEHLYGPFLLDHIICFRGAGESGLELRMEVAKLAEVLRNSLFLLRGGGRDRTMRLEIGGAEWLTIDIPDDATELRVNWSDFPTIALVWHRVSLFFKNIVYFRAIHRGAYVNSDTRFAYMQCTHTRWRRISVEAFLGARRKFLVASKAPYTITSGMAYLALSYGVERYICHRKTWLAYGDDDDAHLAEVEKHEARIRELETTKTHA